MFFVKQRNCGFSPGSERGLSPDLKEFFQNVFHGAEPGKGRLEKIQPHKGCEQVPIGGDPMAQSKGDQDKKTGNGPDILFHFHKLPLFLNELLKTP